MPPISHAQNLEALDILENRYSREIEGAASGAFGKLEHLRLVDLDSKIKKNIPVSMEELCTALANELAKINDRLKALESNPRLGG